MKELKMINVNNTESMINEIMDTACKTYEIYLKTCHKSNKLIGDFEIEHPKYSMDISDGNQYKNENMRFYKLSALLQVLASIKEEHRKIENQYNELLKKLFYERKNLYVMPGYNMTKKAFMQLAHRKTKRLVKNTDCDYRTTLSLVIKRLYEVIKMDLKLQNKIDLRNALKKRISNIFSVDTNEYPEVTIKNWKNQRVYVSLKSKTHHHQLFINLINKNVICNSKCSSMYDVARYVDKYKEVTIDCAI